MPEYFIHFGIISGVMMTFLWDIMGLNCMQFSGLFRRELSPIRQVIGLASEPGVYIGI